MKKLILAFLAVLALAIGSFAFFNAWVYPPLGLEDLGKDQYRTAWERAAKGFCASSGLEFQGDTFIKYRPVESGDEAYCWGAALCRTADGRERLAWIYLEWSTKRKLWTRSYTLVLADDDDEAYFTPAFPKQLGRAATALSKIMGENARHVREYMGRSTP